jgi:hypothetical protein
MLAGRGGPRTRWKRRYGEFAAHGSGSGRGSTNVKRLLCAIASTTGLTASVLVSSIAPAAAEPLDHGQFHDVSTEVVEEFCGDLTVQIDTDLRGSFLVKTQGPDGLVYFLESLHGTVSFTNLATGKSFTNVLNIVDKDLKVTDNGDGTLTILTTTTGSIKNYGPDGSLLFITTGQTRIEILVDHGGTPTDPDDDVLLDERLVRPFTGRSDTEGRDFCADFHLITS